MFITRAATKASNILPSIVFILPPILLATTSTDLLLSLSFLLISIPVSVGLYIYIKRNDLIAISTMIFFSLFFIVAPVVQLLNNDNMLINTMPVNPNTAIVANILTLIFIVSFITFDRFLPKRTKVSNNIFERRNESNSSSPIIPVIVSVYCAYIGLNEISNLSGNLISETNLSEHLIKTKIVLTIPFALTAIYLTTKRNRSYFIIIILIICVILTKNHIIERRNAIGPVYLSLLAMSFPTIIKSGKRFFYFMIFIMLVAFPTSSIFTHASNRFDAKISFSLLIDAITNHFIEPHYDAWANLVATITMVETKGHTFGMQLVGSFLFFIPRSIWPQKPQPTGLMIGEHLSSTYSMWFTNLSAPIVAEGYIDFGIIGVIFLAFLLAIFSRTISKNAKYNSAHHYIIYVYASFFIFFILRGSLMSGFAYFIGATIAIYIAAMLFKIPKLHIYKR